MYATNVRNLKRNPSEALESIQNRGRQILGDGKQLFSAWSIVSLFDRQKMSNRPLK